MTNYLDAIGFLAIICIVPILPLFAKLSILSIMVSIPNLITLPKELLKTSTTGKRFVIKDGNPLSLKKWCNVQTQKTGFGKKRTFIISKPTSFKEDEKVSGVYRVQCRGK